MTPDDNALAAELALGLLDTEELTSARARVLTDRSFAAEVLRWQSWFAPLAWGFGEVEPPASLEARIMAAIAPATATIVRSGGRWAALAMVAVAAAILALVVGPLRAPSPVPVPVPVRVPAPALPVVEPLLAALSVPADQQEEGRTALAAVVDRGTGEVRIVSPAAIPSQRVAELWLIGADGAAPVSIGLLARNAPSRVVVPAALRSLLRAGTTIAVSVEPTGGSTTGSPTGPVIAAGPLAAG